MRKVNGKMKLVGLVSLGGEDESRKRICSSSSEDEVTLATHVLQFVFLGHTGFRFPFAHWPTREVSSVTLKEKFWKAVRWLLEGNFRVHYCGSDGGESNRQMIKAHFEFSDSKCEDNNFCTINPYTREPLFFHHGRTCE